MQGFTHFNEEGRPCMVDVSGKADTVRCATARGRIYMTAETLELVKNGEMAKGDVLAVAQTAAIMGAKRTPDLIPMCHPLLLSGIDVGFSINEAECCIEMEATVKSTGPTGVEMEALTAVSTAGLTIYDMCKAREKGMIISQVCLVQKSGGKSGDYVREFPGNEGLPS